MQGEEGAPHGPALPRAAPMEGRAMPLLHELLQDLPSLPLGLILWQMLFLSRGSCTSLCSREFLIIAVGCLLSPENLNLGNNSV